MSNEAAASFEELMVAIQGVLRLAGNSSELQEAVMDVARLANTCVQEKNKQIDELRAMLVTLRARALYDYTGRDEEELSFKAGDVIEVLDAQSDNQWYYGRLDGKHGVVPITYVTLFQVPVEMSAPAAQPADSLAVSDADSSTPAARKSWFESVRGVVSDIGSVFAMSGEADDEPAPLDISGPTDFKRVSHIGIDADGTYSLENIPDEWRDKFRHLGIGDEYLEHPEHAQFVMDYVMNQEVKLAEEAAASDNAAPSSESVPTPTDANDDAAVSPAPAPANAATPPAANPPPPPPPPPPPSNFNKSPAGAIVRAPPAASPTVTAGRSGMLGDIRSFSKTKLKAAKPVDITTIPKEETADMHSAFLKAFHDKFALVSSADIDEHGGWSDDDDDNGESAQPSSSSAAPAMPSKPKLMPKPKPMPKQP
ncbi:uncharacterized protein AMSG_06706 [Thecamonas trahens ATCC 50062]|uniref:Uncharacterized protein n=1 Tax=Thecamonas trahens ATCC 50062 TaxID=461836 RepID=A0A0L0DET4_THETB|nr:hypothetical protein AMSG_06706 [Thecamonas trahens ATCC 50062]KNC50804.1 hypothetical protein AMSG_06706 [Thecamonas trahens ATCC 50062]|eukprot:XP_013756760.1 hypothetical protein AMSG_06706 [Thecamonas trahens ATCC 50062]